MKKYKYSCTTNTIWTSFDYGEVEANSLEEARVLATIELKQNLVRVNALLASTSFNIEMDLTQLEIEQL